MTRNATANMTAEARLVARSIAAIALAVAIAFTIQVTAPFTHQAFAHGSKSAAVAQVKLICAKKTAEPAPHWVVDPSSGTKTLDIARGRKATIATTRKGGRTTWASSNAKIAKVKPSGLYSARVTALAPGTATITAKNAAGTLTCKIKVSGLTKGSVSIKPFTTSKLRFKGCGMAKAKSWKSSNKKIVKVNAKGKLTPMATGQAVVTCTDTHRVKHKCIVTVNKPNITCAVDPTFLYQTLEGKTVFYQKFKLTNKSGNTIKLNTNAPCYDSTAATAPSTILLTLDSANNYLAKSPLAVKSKQSATFYGKSDRLPWFSSSSESFIKLGFTVGKKRYLAAFSPASGNLLACARK